MITFAHNESLVTWPNPRRGDAEQLEIPKVIRRAMSGKLYSYVSKVYPIKWILGFDTLSQTNVDELRVFLVAVNGEDVVFTDWRNRVYNVKIISNPLQFTQTKNFFTTTLELRGYNA
jgi:hypothetical protein